MAKTTTPAQYALILIDMVESQAVTAIPCWQAPASPGRVLPLSAPGSATGFRQPRRHAQRLTGDPPWASTWGCASPSAHAVLGQAFMTCRDLSQVIDLFLKYYHLLAPALHLEYEIVDDLCLLTTASSLAETPLDFWLRTDVRGHAQHPEGATESR